MITYRKLSDNEIDRFIEMRINQLREEGAKEDIGIRPALTDYYKRHLADGTFVSWIANTLLLHIVDEAREAGCGTVQITASDMGVLLYTALGFTKNNNFMHYKL